jgi:hypothetical protein
MGGRDKRHGLKAEEENGNLCKPFVTWFLFTVVVTIAPIFIVWLLKILGGETATLLARDYIIMAISLSCAVFRDANSDGRTGLRTKHWVISGMMVIFLLGYMMLIGIGFVPPGAEDQLQHHDTSGNYNPDYYILLSETKVKQAIFISGGASIICGIIVKHKEVKDFFRGVSQFFVRRTGELKKMIKRS